MLKPNLRRYCVRVSVTVEFESGEGVFVAPPGFPTEAGDRLWAIIEPHFRRENARVDAVESLMFDRESEDEE